MGRNKNLLAKLDAHKGRDIEAEKKKKEVKAAEKRKQEKAERKAKEAALLGDGEIGVEKSAAENGVNGKDVCVILI